jgi:hypothetical protein
MSTSLDEMYDELNFPLEISSETTTAFAVTTQEQAIWAIRKLNRISARFQESRQTASVELKKIDDWIEGTRVKAERETTYFNGLLRDYMTTLRTDDPKLKAVSLPGAKLAFRKQQPEYIYDEDQLLPWVKANLPEAVVVKESVSKITVKDYIKETGEAIPGVEIEERPDKFEVKLEVV